MPIRHKISQCFGYMCLNIGGLRFLVHRSFDAGNLFL